MVVNAVFSSRTSLGSATRAFVSVAEFTVRLMPGKARCLSRAGRRAWVDGGAWQFCRPLADGRCCRQR
eukprot:6649192-Prymnesium_polylepis.1